MLPVEYFSPKRTITVDVFHCAETPILRTDQPVQNADGSGWMARNESMRRLLSGIAPAQIRQAVALELARQLDGTFTIAERNAQLVLKVSISEWGCYVPTGRFGANRGGRQFRLGGTATILDLDPAQDGAKAFCAYARSHTSLDDSRTKEQCEAALPKAAEDFAAEIVRFILQGQLP